MVNQLAKANSWDNDVYSISILEMNNFLSINSKNIAISLYRMEDFIRNIKFKGRTEKNVSDIIGFGQAT